MEFDVKLNEYLNIQNLCRLCLCVTETKNVIPIFESHQRPSLQSKIEECISIKMTAEDGLPVHMCLVCFMKVNDWYAFKACAQTSDHHLRNLQANGSGLYIKSNESKENELVEDVLVQIAYGQGCDGPELTNDDAKFMMKTESRVSQQDDSADHEDYASENNSGTDADDDVPLSVVLNKGKGLKKTSKRRSNGSRGRTPKIKPFCMDCTIKFSQLSEYLSHRQEAHGDEAPTEEDLKAADSEAFAVYRCHVCKKDLEDRESLRTHCRDIHNVKVIHPYLCSHCDRQFSCWGLLVIHERQHTGEKPYSCDQCGKENFISLASLKRHKLMHAKVFSCHLCGRNFNCDSALKAHIRCKHTKEKPFLCNVCGRSFSLATILTAHMTSHSSERKYHCEICGFASKTSGNHHRHKARHKKGGDKTFHCETCGKAFETKLKLSSHQIIHRPVRPHVCKLCNKGFLYNNKLERHILLVHAKERPYQCRMCDKKLASKFGLGIHMKTHAKTESQVDLPISLDQVHLILE